MKSFSVPGSGFKASWRSSSPKTLEVRVEVPPEICGGFRRGSSECAVLPLSDLSRPKVGADNCDGECGPSVVGVGRGEIASLS